MLSEHFPYKIQEKRLYEGLIWDGRRAIQLPIAVSWTHCLILVGTNLRIVVKVRDQGYRPTKPLRLNPWITKISLHHILTPPWNHMDYSWKNCKVQTLHLGKIKENRAKRSLEEIVASDTSVSATKHSPTPHHTNIIS